MKTIRSVSTGRTVMRQISKILGRHPLSFTPFVLSAVNHDSLIPLRGESNLSDTRVLAPGCGFCHSAYMSTCTFPELCRQLHSNQPLVLGLQKSLGIPVPAKAQGYSEHYLNFLKKVVSLRAFDVPLPDIKEIFETEKKILQLLHVDSLANSATWYLDYCSTPEPVSARLLLTGYKLDFPLDAQAVQHTLEFNAKDKELFQGDEMGEDVRRVLDKYRELVAALREKVAREKPVLEYALEWSADLLKQH